MAERWRKARHYKTGRTVWLRGFEVSDHGRVRSLTRQLSDGRMCGGKVLARYPDGDGYPHVTIEGVPYAVHVLVTDAFFGPCPPGKERLHGPAGKQDPSVPNLRFGTHLENERDKRRTERGIGRGVSPQFLVVTPVTAGVQR